MGTIVIAGGGAAGLALALALGGRGHRVRVLERGRRPRTGPSSRAQSRGCDRRCRRRRTTTSSMRSGCGRCGGTRRGC
ncbi:FAD-dependent oxidoreductase [Saccharopolyspora sp. ID03-671]|uniref:FAD-dependent oxidoreductase n=1 Tax=Saccharopolyspora sp. ID03-671 TaxID=3073066 RepID=UPI0038738DE0